MHHSVKFQVEVVMRLHGHLIDCGLHGITIIIIFLYKLVHSLHPLATDMACMTTINRASEWMHRSYKANIKIISNIIMSVGYILVFTHQIGITAWVKRLEAGFEKIWTLGDQAITRKAKRCYIASGAEMANNSLEITVLPQATGSDEGATKPEITSYSEAGNIHNLIINSYFH